MGARPDLFSQAQAFHGFLRRMGVTADFVGVEEDVGAYRLVIVPMPFACTDRQAKLLEACVSAGGRVLVTAPAGYKTAANTSADVPPPGPLASLLGVEVQEHDVLGPRFKNAVRLASGEEFPVASFCSLLKLTGAEAIGTYTSQFYAGTPAITRRQVGKGTVTFIGADCSPDCLTAVLKGAVEDAGIRTWEWASPAVEVIPLRAAAGEPELVFVLNHSDEPVALAVPDGSAAEELLTGRTCSGNIPVEPYGVVLLRLT
jgi:beta-galactosidase